MVFGEEEVFEESMWGDVVERTVETPGVIESLEVVEESNASSVPGNKAMIVRQDLIFDRGEGAFREGVVVAAPLGTHALAQFETGEQGAKLRGGILATAIGMEDGGFCNEACGHCLRERSADEVAVKAVGDFPRKNRTREEIENDGEVEPTLRSWNVGNVADDLLARFGRRQAMREQVFGGMSGMIGIGGLWPERTSGTGA